MRVPDGIIGAFVEGFRSTRGRKEDRQSGGHDILGSLEK